MAGGVRDTQVALHCWARGCNIGVSQRGCPNSQQLWRGCKARQLQFRPLPTCTGPTPSGDRSSAYMSAQPLVLLPPPTMNQVSPRMAPAWPAEIRGRKRGTTQLSPLACYHMLIVGWVRSGRSWAVCVPSTGSCA